MPKAQLFFFEKMRTKEIFYKNENMYENRKKKMELLVDFYENKWQNEKQRDFHRLFF